MVVAYPADIGELAGSVPAGSRRRGQKVRLPWDPNFSGDANLRLQASLLVPLPARTHPHQRTQAEGQSRCALRVPSPSPAHGRRSHRRDRRPKSSLLRWLRRESVVEMVIQFDSCIGRHPTVRYPGGVSLGIPRRRLLLAAAREKWEPGRGGVRRRRRQAWTARWRNPRVRIRASRCWIGLIGAGPGSEQILEEREFTVLLLRGGHAAGLAGCEANMRGTVGPAVAILWFPTSNVGRDRAGESQLNVVSPVILGGAGLHGHGAGLLVDELQEALSEARGAHARGATQVSRMLFTPHLPATVQSRVSIGESKRRIELWRLVWQWWRSRGMRAASRLPPYRLLVRRPRGVLMVWMVKWAGAVSKILNIINRAGTFNGLPASSPPPPRSSYLQHILIFIY